MKNTNTYVWGEGY